MEQIKIQNYEREHGAGTFIPFRSLTTGEADHALGSVRQRLGLSDSSDALEVLRIIRDRSALVEGVDAIDRGFDLGSVFSQLNFGTAATAFVNWYRFDTIDEVRTDDLCAIFGDLFYPSSDDIEIFDPGVNWLLSVGHNGSIWVLRTTAR